MVKVNIKKVREFKYLPEQNKVSYEIVMWAVLSFLSLTKDQFFEKTRKGPIVNARRLFSYISKECVENFTTVSCGKLLNNADHTTVVYHIKVVDGYLKYDAALRADVDQIRLLVEKFRLASGCCMIKKKKTTR
jgi:chromosomal replication initiation ATPase DnaA